MATKTREPTTDGYEYRFADWVYRVPGALLIVVGFGALLLLTLF